MLLDEAPRRARRISLTPMIDVVFLLLVFFMLAARFGVEGVMPVVAAGGGGTWSGPPRLVDVRPDSLSLNGAPIAPAALAAELARLSESPSDPVVLRGREGATLQRLADVARAASGGGLRPVILAE
ncbi:biopolymer transporter ExbD [uncultured Albimonas sp.]|uniref:ExbD/TolR family protein n=1 Tax=uncultured Albimonas sp. TaxID=1331701 RepID=UPI0030ED3085|tara:strand:+ start:131 stop:508 length:378 start_codon:yes stop_codon:yes gene_type:complete